MLLFAKNFIKQLKLPLKGFEPEPFKGAIIFLFYLDSNHGFQWFSRNRTKLASLAYFDE